MFKVLTEGCKPKRGSKYSAFVDLYASEDKVIGIGDTAIVGLGVAIDTEYYKDYHDVKRSHYMQLEPRSSLRAKGLIAGTGVIDLDYADEIKLIVHNFRKDEFKITKGDKIAQISLIEHKSYWFNIDSEDVRVGGIGSTDKCKVVVA